jgi:protein ImuA
MPARPPDALLADLRRRIAAIEADGTPRPPLPVRSVLIPLGPPRLDEALGGGLIAGSLNEAVPRTIGDIGAAFGFALALAARAVAIRGAGALFHIHEELAAREAGALYPAGLEAFGLAPQALLSLTVRRRADLLLAMEEALKCRALACVIGEAFPDRRGIGLTASRRLALAAKAGGSLGLLVRAPGSVAPSAAVTRWEIEAGPSRSDAFGGLGAPALVVHLVRSKLGRTGSWRLEWSLHDRVFAETEISRPLAASPPHRPDRAREASARQSRMA